MRAAATGLSELDGQMLLDLDRADDAELETLFAEAEAAEAEGRFDEAAALLPALPRHRSRRLRRRLQPRQLPARRRPADEAAHDYRARHQARPRLRRGLVQPRRAARASAARPTRRAGICSKAIALDGDYADAVFNLAKLEFDAGNLAEARRWWARYLELDSQSEWARTAARGIQFVDLAAAPANDG